MLDPSLIQAATLLARSVWLTYVYTHSAPEDIDPTVLQCVLAEVSFIAEEDLKCALCDGYERKPWKERTPRPVSRGSSC